MYSLNTVRKLEKFILLSYTACMGTLLLKMSGRAHIITNFLAIKKSYPKTMNSFKVNNTEIL